MFLLQEWKRTRRLSEYFNSSYFPVGELVIVKDRLKTGKRYCLAYRFDIYAYKPMSRDYVWVDAITGDIIDMETRLRFANATGTAATRYISRRVSYCNRFLTTARSESAITVNFL
ncbi:MAG: hypothetical protein LBE56_14310 [Tannerella sp.]|jgi:hypothetical protein|nr:hypothetical protein [Tannerella sp.]